MIYRATIYRVMLIQAGRNFQKGQELAPSRRRPPIDGVPS